MSNEFLRETAQLSLRLLLVLEACGSVALSHPDNCGCGVCAAAHGDVGALLVVTDALDRWREARARAN